MIHVPTPLAAGPVRTRKILEIGLLSGGALNITWRIGMNCESIKRVGYRTSEPGYLVKHTHNDMPCETFVPDHAISAVTSYYPDHQLEIENRT